MKIHTSAAVAAFALAAVLFASPDALAASACPGGGTQKCTFHCTGPVTAPVCTEGPPCTCTLGVRRPGARATAAARSKVGIRQRGGVVGVAPANRQFQQMRSGGGSRRR